MTSHVKRTQRDYSLTFKLAVVDQVEKGEMTYTQAQKRYGIQGSSTVLVWLRKHGRLDWSIGIPSLSQSESGSTMKQESSAQTPEQRIKELEQQLKETQMKADFFEAVVDVLKKDFGVSITKKPPGKSSRQKR